MGSMLRDAIARNLRKPGATLVGRIVTGLLVKRNGTLEREAVRLCKIQPDRQVLELGFGPGLGIEAACQLVRGGKGKVYGVDFSEEMVIAATKRVKKDIDDGKVELINGDVADLSCFQSNTFDCVFHCNCYYFWPDIDKVARELHRVMKPDSLMVTTMSIERVKRIQALGFLRYANPDQTRYMKALESSGFCDVRSEKEKSEKSGKVYDAIFAKKSSS
ncbi:uncharacterized protein LOC110457576 isoform X2 [Mizuhopecten yessoensis]|nr:uncharacterized protein LOC110457576 isoform X2 [Mizuhopecten yessoensis]XP_021364586.1 uncharacterized protein LOC110457576 isoform X2 [Mizuhopecten yessoensis]